MKAVAASGSVMISPPFRILFRVTGARAYQYTHQENRMLLESLELSNPSVLAL